MNYLVDTNILTRLIEPGHAMHMPALDAVKLIAAQGHRLHIVSRNLHEFWVVCIRPPVVNGMGMTVAETVAEMTHLRAWFRWLHAGPMGFSRLTGGPNLHGGFSERRGR